MSTGGEDKKWGPQGTTRAFLYEYLTKSVFGKQLASGLNRGSELYVNRVARAPQFSVRASGCPGQRPAVQLGERACPQPHISSMATL